MFGTQGVVPTISSSSLVTPMATEAVSASSLLVFPRSSRSLASLSASRMSLNLDTVVSLVVNSSCHFDLFDDHRLTVEFIL
jgi:hypothetical protein